MNSIHEIDVQNFKIIREGVIESIESAAKIFDNEGIKVLDVAPQDWSGAEEFFKSASIDTLDIDPESNATYIADITKNNYKLILSEQYDVVIMTEVLEHTLNPFQAVNEIYRILKNGGHLIMTTPFNFRIHGPLPDCWRFSEHGIRALLTDFDSVIIEEKGDDRFLFPVQYKTIARK